MFLGSFHDIVYLIESTTNKLQVEKESPQEHEGLQMEDGVDTTIVPDIRSNLNDNAGRHLANITDLPLR